eukprot:6866969-Alexandrium_andersonii.AAC.1
MPENAEENNEKAMQDTLNRLGNQTAEKDECEAKENEPMGLVNHESVENSIMRGLHQAAGGGGGMARDKFEGGQKETDEK